MFFCESESLVYRLRGYAGVSSVCFLIECLQFKDGESHEVPTVSNLLRCQEVGLLF